MNIIELIKVIILGVVEGITEWLPISSTGHMILVDEFIKLDVSAEFLEMFLVVIQLGAILAVVVLYWQKLIPFDYKNNWKIKKDTFSMWFKIVIANNWNFSINCSNFSWYFTIWSHYCWSFIDWC